MINDPVNHPSHYTQGKIEVIDFIEDQKLPYHLGNAVKYICRAGKKAGNTEQQDLEKAKWYLNRYIEKVVMGMECKIIDGIVVDYEGEMDDAELTAYVERGRKKYGKSLRGIQCIQDADDQEYVDITYNVKQQNFQRLRRITGYLVGDLNRWNNGKRAEEKDRVKHG